MEPPASLLPSTHFDYDAPYTYVHSIFSVLSARADALLSVSERGQFLFNKVTSLETLRPVSAVFDPAKTQKRAFFEFVLFHASGVTWPPMMVEAYLLGAPDDGLALCTLEDPGRALLFPVLRRRHLKLIESSPTEVLMGTLSGTKIALRTRDKTQMEMWLPDFKSLFPDTQSAFSAATSTTTSSTSRSPDLALGLQYSFYSGKDEILSNMGGLGIINPNYRPASSVYSPDTNTESFGSNSKDLSPQLEIMETSQSLTDAPELQQFLMTMEFYEIKTPPVEIDSSIDIHSPSEVTDTTQSVADPVSQSESPIDQDNISEHEYDSDFSDSSDSEDDEYIEENGNETNGENELYFPQITDNLPENLPTYLPPIPSTARTSSGESLAHSGLPLLEEDNTESFSDVLNINNGPEVRSMHLPSEEEEEDEPERQPAKPLARKKSLSSFFSLSRRKSMKSIEPTTAKEPQLKSKKSTSSISSFFILSEKNHRLKEAKSTSSLSSLFMLGTSKKNTKNKPKLNKKVSAPSFFHSNASEKTPVQKSNKKSKFVAGIKSLLTKKSSKSNLNKSLSGPNLSSSNNSDMGARVHITDSEIEHFINEEEFPEFVSKKKDPSIVQFNTIRTSPDMDEFQRVIQGNIRFGAKARPDKVLSKILEESSIAEELLQFEEVLHEDLEEFELKPEPITISTVQEEEEEEEEGEKEVEVNKIIAEEVKIEDVPAMTRSSSESSIGTAIDSSMHNRTASTSVSISNFSESSSGSRTPGPRTRRVRKSSSESTLADRVSFARASEKISVLKTDATVSRWDSRAWQKVVETTMTVKVFRTGLNSCYVSCYNNETVLLELTVENGRSQVHRRGALDVHVKTTDTYLFRFNNSFLAEEFEDIARRSEDDGRGPPGLSRKTSTGSMSSRTTCPTYLPPLLSGSALTRSPSVLDLLRPAQPVIVKEPELLVANNVRSRLYSHVAAVDRWQDLGHARVRVYACSAENWVRIMVLKATSAAVMLDTRLPKSRFRMEGTLGVAITMLNTEVPGYMLRMESMKEAATMSDVLTAM